MKKGKILVGYLTYITDENSVRRFDNFQKSLKALELFGSDVCDILLVDNNSNTETVDILRNSDIFKYRIFYKKNFIDSGHLFTTATIAKREGYEYMLYMYDDFIVTRRDVLEDCVSFLDNYKDLNSLRIPEYSVENQQYFDTQFTPKSENPDSVRHYNSVTKQGLKWFGPAKINNNKFYVNNWHYTSRPTLWRTDAFLKLFDDLEEIPVMQNFERYAGNKLIDEFVGVLDNGIMKTVKQSERTHLTMKLNNSIADTETPPIKKKEISDQLENLLKNWSSNEKH